MNEAAGFRPGDVCINTFGCHMTPAGMMFDDSLTNVGCAVVPTGVGEREAQVQIMKTLGAKGYLGRADQLVKVKGMFVHSGQLQGVLREFPEVNRFRAVATRDGNRDQVTLYIDTGAALDSALVERLQQRLRDVLRIGVAVTEGDDSRFPADGLVLADERIWD